MEQIRQPQPRSCAELPAVELRRLFELSTGRVEIRQVYACGIDHGRAGGAVQEASVRRGRDGALPQIFKGTRQPQLPVVLQCRDLARQLLEMFFGLLGHAEGAFAQNPLVGQSGPFSSGEVGRRGVDALQVSKGAVVPAL